jgi:predicted RNase H-like HicB family nuclease
MTTRYTLHYREKHGALTMAGQYTAIIRKAGDWYIGWIEEIPGVNCQERTLEELRLSLQEALVDILAIRHQQALADAGSDFIKEPIALMP